MDEASSRFVDRLAVDKLVQEKLSKVHHGHHQSPQDWVARPILESDVGTLLRSYPAPEPRATVLFAHGLYEDQRDIYRFLFAGLNRLGFSVELYCLPFHYERKPAESLFSGEYFFSANLYRTRGAFLQAADEVVACYEGLRRKTGKPVFLAGFSMGASILLQAVPRLDEVAGVCVLNPPAGLADLIWDSPLCRTIRADLEAANIEHHAVAAHFQDIDPLYTPNRPSSKHHFLMIQATYDLVTRQEQYEALAAAWQFPHRLKYNAGHLNTLRVPRLAEDMARFFAARMSQEIR